MSGLQLEEKVRRPGYEEPRKILTDALLSAGIQIQWFKRPTPVLKAKFTVHDPHGSPDYKLVRIEIDLENRGEKSIRNPKIRIQYTDPGVAALSEYAPWTRSHPIESLNPRTLELSRIIRPGEQSSVLPIDYRLKNFETIGIQCQIFMDDERPAQTGITIARQELTEGLEREVGEENYFPSLTFVPRQHARMP